MYYFFLKWRWEFLSLLAGFLLTLAFSPFEFSYLAVVSLVLVFLSWQDCSAARAAVRAYIFGLGLFGTGISWVYVSVHYYGGAPAIGAALLTLLVVLFWSVFPALTGYFSVKISGDKSKNRLIWVIPFIWIFIEYFRGYWFLNGFPWLQIAYTQLGTPLQGFVPVMGVYGTGFLLALTASSLAAGLRKVHLTTSSTGLSFCTPSSFWQQFCSLLRGRYQVLKTNKNTTLVEELIPCAFLRNLIKFRNILIFIVLLWGGGAFLQTIKWTKPIGKAINVALIQGNVSQEEKWLPNNRITTLLSYRQMTVQNWDADVIVWPETAIPAYLSQVKKNFLDPLSVEAKAHDTDLIVSLPSSNNKNEHFNTVLTLGKNEGRYDKNHLLPFGEYLPLQPVSGAILDLLNIHLGNFTSGGDNQKLLQAGGYAFNTSICYEDAFAVEAKRGLPEAAFLVNVTNDAWFGDSLEPHQHMQIAQMRALETGRYLLRATNTGVTAIVAPDGSIVSSTPMFQQTVLRGNILPMGGSTLYTRLNDEVIVYILVFLLFTVILVHRKI